MNQKKLLKILESKCIDVTRIPLTYLIKGDWGIGKSFLWTRLTEMKKNKKINFIKVSLFGLESIDMLDQKLKIEYLKKDSKIKEGFQQTLKIINKKITAGQIDVLPFISFSGNSIICFDDVERKSEKLNLKDIMGYIENISLTSTVFILMNEKKLENDPDYDSYIEYKEKLIDYEYELTEVSEDMCKEVLSYSNLELEYIEEIIEVFQINNQTNYRTLIKIERLVQNLLFELKHMSIDLVNLSSLAVIEKISKHPEIKDEIKVSNFIYKEKIKVYLETNFININDFEKLIYPEKSNDYKVELINKNITNCTIELNNIFLKNEEEFVALYRQTLLLVNESIGLKLEFNLIIDLWVSVRNLSEKFTLITNEKINVDEEFKRLIAAAIEKMDMSELDILYDDLSLRFNRYHDKFVSNDLVKILIPLVEKIRITKNTEQIDKLIEANEFNEVVKIFKSNPKLIIKKCKLFKELTNKKLSIEYYNFLKRVSFVISDKDARNILADYIEGLKETTTDIIITERFIAFNHLKLY